ncbi:hypothetical protein LINGRAHAP2_LOCUS2870 [Linum grandiflorum]
MHAIVDSLRAIQHYNNDIAVSCGQWPPPSLKTSSKSGATPNNKGRRVVDGSRTSSYRKSAPTMSTKKV